MISFSLLVIFLVLVGLLVVIISYTHKNKMRIPVMTGMMIAMTLGMMIGLFSGVIAGVLFAGNLFLSTVVGMLIGLIVGFVAGIPINIMAVLDGMMAGIMGGMMGAMVGDMIAPSHKDTIINILFVLTLGILLILLYMIQQEILSTDRRTNWFQRPIIVGTVIIVFFAIFIK